MHEVLVLALSFPSVVYTVLLGVVLIYWAFVMVGVIHIGEGSEGALDGHVDGAAKGLMEGATKGLMEGAVDQLHAGHVDVGDIGGDGDIGDVDVDESGSALAAIMSALHLRSVPATVILSLIITFAWLCSVVSMQVVTRLFPALTGPLLSVGVFLA